MGELTQAKQDYEAACLGLPHLPTHLRDKHCQTTNSLSVLCSCFHNMPSFEEWQEALVERYYSTDKKYMRNLLALWEFYIVSTHNLLPDI